MNATGTKNLFEDCERYVIIMYEFKDGEADIKTESKSRIYPSVRMESVIQ